MNTKPIPIILTLIAAFISCLASILQGEDFSVFVFRLLIVVIVFLIIGTLIKMLIDTSFKVFEEVPETDEGEESFDEDSEEESEASGETDEQAPAEDLM